MSVAGVGKTVTNIAQNIIKVMKEGADIATNPNHTQADIDKFYQDLDNVFKSSGQDSSDAARAEAKEAVTKHLLDGGMSKVEVEQWMGEHWKKIMDLAEKARKTLPKVEQGAKLKWLKFVGAITAMAAGGIIFTAVTTRPSPESIAMNNSLQTEAAETAQMQAFMVSEDEFNMMIGGLEVGSGPVPTENTAPIEAAQAPEQLPAAVAAEAEAPVEVVVTTDSGTQNFTTTVAQVYRNVPTPARQAIERQAPPPIDHGYDHENLNDCAHTHCLGSDGHLDAGFHKSFTVDSPIGSASFSY